LVVLLGSRLPFHLQFSLPGLLEGHAARDADRQLALQCLLLDFLDVREPRRPSDVANAHDAACQLGEAADRQVASHEQQYAACDDHAAVCRDLGWPDRTLYVEKFVPFERELAVIVVRGRDGEMINYSVVETQQDPELQICRNVFAPADISAELADRAARIARDAVEAVDGMGTFGIELFLLPDQRILVNELAPRPHNTGHYTIEVCVTSQFENHVRAVLGLPLGDPAMRAPAAAIVNLLGHGGEMPDRSQYSCVLEVPGVHLHIYGKDQSRPGRKMGHITVCGTSVDEAFKRALTAAERIRM
jgi:5-(carboxyamino)imidazole ribonucleotide synthase